MDDNRSGRFLMTVACMCGVLAACSSSQVSGPGASQATPGGTGQVLSRATLQLGTCHQLLRLFRHRHRPLQD